MASCAPDCPLTWSKTLTPHGQGFAQSIRLGSLTDFSPTDTLSTSGVSRWPSHLFVEMQERSAMEVVLINPPPFRLIEDADRPNYPHPGIACLAAYLRERGQQVRVIDAKLQRLSLEETVEAACRSGDLWGLSGMTHEVAQAARVAEGIKRRRGDVPVVLGGVHATALPKETLERFPQLDFAVVGEGEYTFAELVEALQDGRSLQRVPGLGWRRGSRIVLNRPRGFIQNLDALPIPAWDLFPPTPFYYLATARGCPYACNFCTRVMGRRVRALSAERLLDYLDVLVNKRQAREVHFSDDVFGADRRRAYRLLELMVERGFHRKLRWQTSTRADLVTPRLLQKMKEAGCDYVSFGCESGNARILKNTGKGITLEQIERAVGWTKEAGIKTGALFIIGHPHETRATAWETIRFATRLNPHVVALGIMVPYPGTEVAEMARRGEGGYRLLSEDWSDFGKQFGNALELVSLSRRHLEWLQAVGYLTVYWANARWLELARFIWHYRRAAWARARKLCSPKTVTRN